MPKFALGVASGVAKFLTSQAQVVTADTGSLGVGTGTGHILIPPNVMSYALLAGFASVKSLGPYTPPMAMGLANGLCAGLLALAVIRTNHPGIGTGAGIGKIVAPSSVPSLVQGFSDVGVKGQAASRQAKAIGFGLDVVLQSLVVPVAIVGVGSPSAGAAVGFGQIV